MSHTLIGGLELCIVSIGTCRLCLICLEPVVVQVLRLQDRDDMAYSFAVKFFSGYDPWYQTPFGEKVISRPCLSAHELDRGKSVPAAKHYLLFAPPTWNSFSSVPI